MPTSVEGEGNTTSHNGKNATFSEESLVQEKTQKMKRLSGGVKLGLNSNGKRRVVKLGNYQKTTCLANPKTTSTEKSKGFAGLAPQEEGKIYYV